MTVNEAGLLDTSVIIGLSSVPASRLPNLVCISAVTLAELTQGVQVAVDPAARSLRLERLQWIESIFQLPLPFDAAAARLYGTLVGLIVSGGRNPRPRRLDLMIAATAGIRDIPIYTRNAKDLLGIEPRVKVVEV